MADTAITTQIRETLAERLRGIAIANGYRTDAGADVRTEPSEFVASDAPRITIFPGGKVRPDDARAKTEREFSVVVEAMVSVQMESPLAEIEAMEADIEQALEGYLQQPMALPLQSTESLFLERPDGLPAMCVQMMLQTRFR